MKSLWLESSSRSIIIAVASLALAIPFHLRPDNFIVDDGYFYPQIARLIVHGQGSTFNGIMPTNGYHPLWMIICLIGARIDSSSYALVQMLGFVQDIFLSIVVALLVMVGSKAGKRGAVLGCAPVIFFGMVIGIWRLLEAPLALLLQICTLVLVVPIFPDFQQRIERYRIPLVGLMLGLTILSRLDLIFFAGIVLAYECMRQDMGGVMSRIRSVLSQGTIAATLVIPYLIWNVEYFHHLMPISGAIKRSIRPHFDRHIGLAGIPVVIAILLNSLLLLKRERTHYDVLCLITASAAALHLFYTLCFGGLSAWYLTTGYLSVCLCMTWLANYALARMPSLCWMEPAFCSFLFVAFLLLASLRLFSNFSTTRLLNRKVSFQANYLEPKRDLAIRLQQTIPAGSRIFIFDAPGGVAFYSRMAILPADGLVTDYAYNSDLEREGFERYAAQNHIDYFITPYLQNGQSYDYLFLRGKREGGTQQMQIEVPLTKRSAGSVSLSSADLLFRFREINPDLENTYPEIGIWRIHHDGYSAY